MTLYDRVVNAYEALLRTLPEQPPGGGKSEVVIEKELIEQFRQFVVMADEGLIPPRSMIESGKSLLAQVIGE